MGKTLKASQGVCIAVGRGEYNGATEAFHKAALAGNAEFRAEISKYVGDDVHKLGW